MSNKDVYEFFWCTECYRYACKYTFMLLHNYIGSNIK